MSTEIRIIDPVLTSLAQEYKNAGFVADKIFPLVSVNRRKGKIPIFGKQAFVHRDTIRAVRADSNRIPAEEISYYEFELLERDVEVSLDYIEEEEYSNSLQIEQQATNELIDILLLGREKEVSDFLQNPANYPTEMTIEITASNAFDDYTKSVDPVTKILEGVSAIRRKISRYPNVMIIGEPTYRALNFHPKILERIKYVGLSKVNLNYLSELLEIKNIYIGLGVYTQNGVDFTDIWGDNIVLAYVEEQDKGKTQRLGSSFGYLLQKAGYPEIDVYYENGGKIKVIRATDVYTYIMTLPYAGFLIYNTNHLS